MNAKEQYDPSEPMTCSKKTLITEIVRLESRLAEMETMLTEQANDFLKAKSDLTRQLAEAYEAIWMNWRTVDGNGWPICRICRKPLAYFAELEEYVHPEPSDCIVLKASAGR